MPAEPQSESLENAVAALISEHEEKLSTVGRALHDGLGQILSGVGLQLEALRLDYQNDAQLAERITELQNNLEQAMSEARALSASLNPSVVERAGLRFALEQLVGKVGTRFDGTVRLQFPSSLHLPREIADAFYRVAVYAIEYALRRTQSTSIDVKVKEARAEATLEVRFDGCAEIDDNSQSLERVESLLLNRQTQRAGIPVVLDAVLGKGTIVRTTYRVRTNSIGS